MSYLQLIKAIKAYTPLLIYGADEELTRKIERLVSANIIQTVMCIHTETNAVGIRITGGITHVHVSHWRGTGERVGKYAGQAYPFVGKITSKSGTNYVTYELAPGINHTVREIYTEVA